MIVDSSAVLAVLFAEDDADRYETTVAKATGEPLLFKGDDFARTDVASALA